MKRTDILAGDIIREAVPGAAHHRVHALLEKGYRTNLGFIGEDHAVVVRHGPLHKGYNKDQPREKDGKFGSGGGGSGSDKGATHDRASGHGADPKDMGVSTPEEHLAQARAHDQEGAKHEDGSAKSIAHIKAASEHRLAAHVLRSSAKKPGDAGLKQRAGQASKEAMIHSANLKSK